MKCDVLIAGVGGQGTILAAKLIAKSAMEDGLFVRSSETIGMAQRGGCVVSHVRVDCQDGSSVIPMGEADVLLAFEPAEAARHIGRLKKGAKAVVNTACVVPVTTSLSGGQYPLKQAMQIVRENAEAYFIDAYEIAGQCGSTKAVNIVLIGAAIGVGAIPFDIERMEQLLRHTLAPKILEMNLVALRSGYEAVRNEK